MVNPVTPRLRYCDNICHSNFCIWHYSKEISLAEISPNAVETIMSIFQKEFFGDNVYLSTINSERVENKRLPPPTAQWFKNLRLRGGLWHAWRLRKQSATCKYMSIPKVWLLAIGLISIRWCCSCSEEIDRSTSGTSTAPVSDESLTHAWLGKSPSWSMP